MMAGEQNDPDAGKGPPRSHRLILPLMFLVFLAGMLDIALITFTGGSIDATVEDSTFRLVEFIQRSGPTADQPTTGGLLSGSFVVSVPRQPMTRYMQITGVELFSSDGKSLGPGEVSMVSGSWNGFDLPAMGSLEQLTDSVRSDSDVVLSPLGPTQVSFRATFQQDFGLKDGSRVYAEIVAVSGSEEFVLMSDSATVST